MKTQKAGDPVKRAEKKSARQAVRIARSDLRTTKQRVARQETNMARRFGNDTSMYPMMDKQFDKNTKKIQEKKSVLKSAKQQRRNTHKS